MLKFTLEPFRGTASDIWPTLLPLPGPKTENGSSKRSLHNCCPWPEALLADGFAFSGLKTESGSSKRLLHTLLPLPEILLANGFTSSGLKTESASSSESGYFLTCPE